jgi:hypothetical protein
MTLYLQMRYVIAFLRLHANMSETGVLCSNACTFLTILDDENSKNTVNYPSLPQFLKMHALHFDGSLETCNDDRCQEYASMPSYAEISPNRNASSACT